ncbi:acyltransferase domain-containing protein [Saccharothrix australiensis]|uniref:Acyl transferase family protein n=1 Tax=Saccharothrix australiensis TaxID=2072 RepID=A0A495W1T5_9PSEU|nr:acyltransferase domain-containing protein [Saccharothrix australiensis]RKT55651.1 acyl transferase family protein [Saccharothrix australiensis]
MDAPPPPTPPVALLLPGQGAQQQRMGAGLYGADPAFTAAMDEVFSAFGDFGVALRADWLAEDPMEPVDVPTRSQPLLFALGYALGRMVLSWGVRPAALLGHSIGEVAAAALAGVFDPADAAALLRLRLDQLADAPEGGMFAVAAGEEDVRPFLGGGVVVGAVNGRRQVVLAGPAAPLALAVERLRAAGLTGTPVPSTLPFHSPALAYSVPGFTEAARRVRLRPPRLTVYSGYTAAPLGVEATDPAFWASHPVAPVRFWPALDALLATGDHLLVEAGPGLGLVTLARRHRSVRPGGSAVAALLPARAGDPAADRAAARAVADLVTAGRARVPSLRRNSR